MLENHLHSQNHFFSENQLTWRFRIRRSSAKQTHMWYDDHLSSCTINIFFSQQNNTYHQPPAMGTSISSSKLNQISVLLAYARRRSLLFVKDKFPKQGKHVHFVHNKGLPLVMRAWRTVNKLFFMVVCVSCDNQVNRACLVRQIDFEVMSKFRQFAGNWPY